MTPTTTLDDLWKRCASLYDVLAEEPFSMFPPDWERLSDRLDEYLGEMEERSPAHRQRFELRFGR